MAWSAWAILGLVRGAQAQQAPATNPATGPEATAAVAAADPADPVAPSYYAGEGERPTAPRVEMSAFDTIVESLAGDAYTPGQWRRLGLRTFFTEGWFEPWAGGPAGGDGLAPRQGWLGAFDGVFYRLYFNTFTYSNGLNAPYGGNRYSGTTDIFLPLSRRFEVLLDIPFVVANGTANPRAGYVSQFGDLSVIPRFLLSETERLSQVFALGIQTPTGAKQTAGDMLALTPRYEFWANPGGAWVVRGAAGLTTGLGGKAGESFNGGLAVGRYLTGHDDAIGDLVLYGAFNYSTPFGAASTAGTTIGIGPGTRFHLGKDYYFLNYWEFPITTTHPNSYTVQFALLKVF